MTTQYLSVGILLAFFSGCCLLAGIANILRDRRRKPAYLRKLPKQQYTEEIIEAIKSAYEAAGDIRGMLLILREKWRQGPAGKRIPAALEYLEHGRYRDYETALSFLSDKSESCETAIHEILDKEIRKQRGLICKN